MSEIKVVTFTAVDGYHLRSFFNTGIVDRLLDRGVLVNCVCTHSGKELRQRYESRGVRFFVIVAKRPGVFEWILLTMSSGIFRKRVPKQDLICYRVNSGFVRRLISGLSATFLPSERVFRFLDSVIRNRSNPVDVITHFDQNPCDLLVSGTPGWKYPELPYLREAIRRKIPVITQILSWDNLSMKGPFGIRPDFIMVWNGYMKSLAVSYFGMTGKQVYVTGAPQFDIYHQGQVSKIEAKAEFIAGLDADARKFDKFIVIAGIPLSLAPFQPALIRQVIDLVDSGDLDKRVAVIVRPHPQSLLEDYQLPASERLFVNSPVAHTSNRATDLAFRWPYSENSLSELAKVLRGADVVITIASSVTLDSSAVATPTINIAYDPEGKFPEDVLASYYRSHHYSLITESGAVPLVKSREELLDSLREALRHPEKLLHKRQRLVESICGSFDQSAAEKQARLILDHLGHSFDPIK